MNDPLVHTAGQSEEAGRTESTARYGRDLLFQKEWTERHILFLGSKGRLRLLQQRQTRIMIDLPAVQMVRVLFTDQSLQGLVHGLDPAFDHDRGQADARHARFT